MTTTALIDALTRRDFAGLASSLADDVRFRAVLPRAELDQVGAQEAAARFETWFGGADDFEVVESSVGRVGPREYARWLIRMWPAGHPEDARIVEQHVFTRGEGKVECLDLLCSGFQPERRT